MILWSLVTEGLAHDVSIWGLRSPLLSWFGAFGLVLFFGWQVSRLLVGVARASAPFAEVEPVLTAYADEIEGSDLRQSYDRAVSDGRDGVTGGAPAASAVTDIARLTRLDKAMREVDVLRRPWVQFRKTILIERVPWFKEPRIFSTRRAEEFFTEDAVLGSTIDLGFLGQVPSLITGVGLLLTFVALCVGLSRLHADGPTVTGIQGLINGLAGKFLTSIVAMICANVFIVLDRHVVRRLMARHAEFLALLDESFPRRTVEDLLDALGHHKSPRKRVGADDRAHDEVGGQESHERLGVSIEALTSAVRGLSTRTRDPGPALEALAAAIEGLQQNQSRIATVVEELTRTLAPVAAELSSAVEPRDVRSTGRRFLGDRNLLSLVRGDRRRG